MIYLLDFLNLFCMKCQFIRNIFIDESFIKYDLFLMSVSNVKRIFFKFNYLVNSKKKKKRQNNFYNVIECCLLYCVKICLIIYVLSNYFWRYLNVFGIFCSVIQEYWEEVIMYVMLKILIRNGIVIMIVVVK